MISATEEEVIAPTEVYTGARDELDFTALKADAEADVSVVVSVKLLVLPERTVIAARFAAVVGATVAVTVVAATELSVEASVCVI